MSTRYDNTGDPHNDHIFRWFNERYPEEMTGCLDNLPDDAGSLAGERGRRTAELEANVQTALNALHVQTLRAEQAEAALAERDRMLRLAIEHLRNSDCGYYPRWDADKVLDDLRARAERNTP